MNDTQTTLDKKEILRLEHETRQLTSKMSKTQLQDYINDLLDKVLVDSGDLVLRERAAIAGKIWNGRYSR